MVVSQELPPKGGYEAVQWKRNLPSRGFRPSIYLGIMGVFSLVGLYGMTLEMRDRREEKREKMWARIYLSPLLQAEADRDFVRRYYATQAREQEIMKNHPDWADGKPIYHDGRLRAPTFTILDAAKEV